MNCPFRGCGTIETRVVDSRRESSDYVSKKFAGHNVVRRKRICRFGHKFFTIEMVEDDYIYLKAERGRLEPPLAGAKMGKI